MNKGSRIFVPSRSLGLVCNEVRPVLRYLKKRKHAMIICAVGSVFHAYHSGSLRIIAASNPHPADIQCLAADGLYVYTGCKSVIRAFHLSRQVKYVFDGGHSSDVVFILPFGEYLVSVDSSSLLIVWTIQTQEKHLELQHDPGTFAISAICHPPTYLNKILLGSGQGALRLYNLRTSKLIYEVAGWKSGVEVIEPSPAIDVVAISLRSGRIILHNIKLDETLFSFTLEDAIPTSLAFRLDGPPMLINGDSSGALSIWDLDKRKLVGRIDGIHTREVVGLGFAPLEPIFYSSSPDNCLKVWIFDMPESSEARLLNSLMGHSSPPTRVRFHGSNGEMLISTGSDDCTIKMFSTLKMTKRYNLGTAGTMSRKKAKRKKIDTEEIRLPRITNVASDTSRESGWDNILATHSGCPVVSTWTTRRLRLGSHRLEHGRFGSDARWKNGVALCCTVSACGNFAIIGYSTGHIDVFNIQSGLYRWSYTDRDILPSRAHESGVRGVCVDALNKTTISGSTGAASENTSGLLKFWQFKASRRDGNVLVHKLGLDAPVSLMMIHRANGMLAVALDNFSVVVVDVACKQLARAINDCHTGHITDFTFNPSGHWLVTASQDCTVKVWDLPTCALVDVLSLNEPCSSINFSPLGNYLATTHTGCLGIYLWLNRAVYLPHLSLRPLPNDFEPSEVVDLPGTSTSTESAVAAIDSSDDLNDSKVKMELDDDEMELVSDEQIESLVTLSGLPPSHWANLTSLDVIKARNRPKEPPEKPKAAPFFLPTVAGLDPKFDVPSTSGQSDSSSRILNFARLEPRSEFTRSLLTEGSEIAAFNLLKEYGPSRIDSEIRALASTSGGSVDHLAQFLALVEKVLESRRDFEVIQSYLGLFLKVHREELWASPSLNDSLNRVLVQQRAAWNEMDESLNGCLCLAQYLRSAVL